MNEEQPESETDRVIDGTIETEEIEHEEIWALLDRNQFLVRSERGDVMQMLNLEDMEATGIRL